MNHKKLEKNLIDLIKEEQSKLGYRKEEVRLYYPLQSLQHFYDCADSADEMQMRLSDLPATVAATLGSVGISHKGDRFCFVIPETGTEYVHTHMKENEFIRQLVELDSDEFDVMIRFTEGDDPYYYCFKDEGCHIIYHRFLPEDYADFGL